MNNLKQGGVLLLLALLGIPSHAPAASGPYEIDIKELDKQKEAQPPKEEGTKPGKAKKGHAAAKGKERRKSGTASDYARYTVKPGDHIFKILMVRFGMSNEEAERLIPEIARINHVSDIRRLHVGQTLLIPVKGKGHAGRTKGAKAGREETPAAKEASARAPEPVTAAKGTAAPVPRPAAPPAAPPAPSASAQAAPVWVCSVTDKAPAKIVDSILNAMSISWSRNRIIHSEEGAATPYSIRVDRYFEYKGERYIVSIGETDPYSYTLFRMLESAGYREITLTGSEDFATVAGKLLGLLRVPLDFEKQPWQDGKEIPGFLIPAEEAGGRRVLITAEPVDAHLKWVMKPGCTVR